MFTKQLIFQLSELLYPFVTAIDGGENFKNSLKNPH